MMEKGRIIYLNGTSSAGKTTLAKALQERLEVPYYGISIDQFLPMCPTKFDMEDDEPGFDMEIAWRNPVVGMYRCIKDFSDRGLNVVVDDVADIPDIFQEGVELLRDYPVLFVNVICPVEELKRRELARGDRQVGQAVEQLEILESLGYDYDLVVDTHALGIEACVDKIVENLDEYWAFKNWRFCR